MKLLVVVTCVILLQLKLKGFNCDNVTLLISPSKYASTLNQSSYCGLSPSEIASLSAINPTPSSPSTPIKVSVVKAILSSPYILSSISPPLVFDFLDGLSLSPYLLQSVEPSTVASLIGTLCASPSLLKTAPSNTVIEFINAITICPKIISALPPSTLVRFLSKLYTETPSVLYGLSPAVRVSLIHSILFADVLGTLKPTEIIFLINFFVSFECTLSELPPSDIVELLQTIASSPILLNNIPTSQIVGFLCRVSKLVPFIFDSVQTNVVNALLTPIISTRSRSTTTLVNLATILSSSPNLLNTVDPMIVSFLLMASSSSSVLNSVPSNVLVKLLTEISFSNTLVKTIDPGAIIGLLYNIKSVSPTMMCDLPPFVRSAFVIHLITAEVTGALSIETSVKLIKTISDNPCFLVGLSLNSTNKIINLMTSTETILTSIPLKKIVGFIYDITVSSPFVLRETPPDGIRKLLSPLTSISSLSSLDPSSYERLLSSISNSPSLLNAISLEQLTNILTTLYSSPGYMKEVPSKAYVDILTQIFTSSKLLPNIPLTLLLNLMINIENYSPDVLLSMPSFAVTAFVDFLGDDPVTLSSLSALDVKNLLRILTDTPSFLTRVSVKTLSALLETVAASYNVPAETKIDLFHGVYALLPSMFYSLPARPLREIVNSFGSFETLSALNTDRLTELTAVVAGCPCLLSALDAAAPSLVANLLDALSASPTALGALSPRTTIDLIAAVASDGGLAAAVPASAWLRLLRALSAAAPGTLPQVPASAYGAALRPLESAGGVDGLTCADFENLLDALIDAPDLWTALPRAVAVNVLTALSGTFTAVSRTKTVVLLVSAHTVSPGLVRAVPTAALADLLDTFVTAADLGAMPPEFVAGLVVVLSGSPSLVDAMSAAAFDALASLLSTSPRTLRQVPPDALARLLAELSLSPPPAALARIKQPLLASLLSSAQSAGVAVPPVALRALLAPLGDPRAVHDLEPTDVATLISTAASSPRVLDAIAGEPLDVLLSRAASSPRLLSFAAPSLMTSFLAAVARSPAALDSARPATLVDTLATLAVSRPAALSALPPSTATALLGAIGTRTALAALPPPAVNSLACLLLAFPNLLAAMPLDALAALLRHLSAEPAVLGALPSCTLARLLAALSTLPPLLRALPPGVLASFLSALSAAAPEFLSALPAPVVTALFTAVAADPTALATATPASVASLIATLNRSPSLVVVLPASVLVAFFTYLSRHPSQLRDTTRRDLLSVIDNVRSPGAVPRVTFNGPPCAFCRFDGDFVSYLSLNSPALAAPDSFGTGKNVSSDDHKSECWLTGLIPPSKCTVIYPMPAAPPPDDSSKNNFEMPIDLMPKLIIPENTKGATVYVYKKDEKLPSDEKTSVIP